MTYVTKQGLVDRFGERELIQLTDRTHIPQTEIDDVPVTRAIGDAVALVDSYVGKRYDLPLQVVPPVLEKNAADIARYYLHGEAAGEDSIVTRNFEAALSWLKDVSKGTVLIDVGGEVPGQAGGGSIKANPSTRVMRRDTLKGL